MSRKIISILLIIVSMVFFIACSSIVDKSAISADGTEIAYSVSGNSDVALVLIHGWSCDRSYWDAQVDDLRKQYRVIAVDLAGHGESGIDRSDWTLDAFGQDVASVLEQEELNKVILIGHSMGGPVALHAARILGDRVIGIIGVDTFQDIETHLTDAQVEGFINAFNINFTLTTDGFVRQMFRVDADPALVEEVATDMASAPPEVGIGAMRAMLSTSLPEVLEVLNVPVTCINSDRYPTKSEVLKKYIENFELKTMTESGHFIMLEKPELFNTVLNGVVAEMTE